MLQGLLFHHYILKVIRQIQCLNPGLYFTMLSIVEVLLLLLLLLSKYELLNNTIIKVKIDFVFNHNTRSD